MLQVSLTNGDLLQGLLAGLLRLFDSLKRFLRGLEELDVPLHDRLNNRFVQRNGRIAGEPQQDGKNENRHAETFANPNK